MEDRDLDEIMLAQLVRAWVRRKRFEARLQANEIGRMLFGDGSKGQAREVSPDQFLRMTGQG